MGIKGLFQFLSRYEQRVTTVEAVKGKLVGVDIFWFLHQSKGDLSIIYHYLHQIIQHAKEVHCVWDGPPSSDTKNIRKEKEQHRQEIIQSIVQLDTFLTHQMDQLSEEDQSTLQQYVEQLRKKSWKATPEYICTVKEWLKEQGCYQYQSTGEADTLLMELEKEHHVELLISNDSDLLALGSACLLRVYDEEGALFDKKSIYKKWGWTSCQWDDFMTLCRLMKEPDVVMAYSWISVYRELDVILKKQMEWKRELVVDKNSND
jgi:5'-3' exonuclease